MKFLHLEEIDSTNKYAKEHIDELSDLTVIYTSNQTNGRGRFERKWINTGSNNIYASFVLKPSVEMKDIYSNLTQYLCVILAEVFEDFNIQPQIKWPNDIRVNGKKISGILAEAVIDKNELKGLILGVGINISSRVKDLENIDQACTSLYIETGMEIDKEIFLKKLSDKFCLRYNNFIEEGFLLIREEYLRRAEFLNKSVTVKVFDKEISGTVKDVTENGALRLIDNTDKEHVLLIGDIL